MDSGLEFQHLDGFFLAPVSAATPVSFAIEIINRQRTFRFDRNFLTRMLLAAYPSCLAACRHGDVPLQSLGGVEVSILSNRRIGAVHAEFFQDPGFTDVITFQHGEIILGAGVVVENAGRFGRSPDEEAALCLMHGLLHLAGWEDGSAEEAEKMSRRQEQIFKQARGMVDSKPSHE